MDTNDLPYTKSPQPLFGRSIATAFLYTMNNTEEEMARHGFASHLQVIEGYLKLVFGRLETLHCYDTLQFDDYSKYVADKFDPEKKKRIRETVFPEDCRKGFEVGRRTASPRQSARR